MRHAAPTVALLCLFAGVAAVAEAQDPKQLEQNCNAGDLKACVEFGRLYREGGPGLNKDRARAASFFERACNGGNAAGCLELGDLVASPDDRAARDMTRAVQLFQKACDGQSGPGCARLGDAYLLRQGVDRDLTRASLAYERACDMGAGSIIANSCHMVAQIHDPKDGDLKDAKRWVTFLEKACNTGEGGDCLRIGLAYDLGMWVTANATHAIDLFKKGCFFGNKEACNLMRR